MSTVFVYFQTLTQEKPKWKDIQLKNVANIGDVEDALREKNSFKDYYKDIPVDIDFYPYGALDDQGNVKQTKLLKSSQKVLDHEILPLDDDGCINILAVVTQLQGAATNPNQNNLEKEIADIKVMLHSMVVHKEKSISKVSGVDWTLCRQVMEINTRKAKFQTPIPETPNQTNPFVWLKETTKNAQMGNALEWLRANIPLPEELIYLDVSHNGTFLNCFKEGLDFLPFSLKGTTDIVITEKDDSSSQNIFFAVELKKELMEKNYYQAYFQLVAASIHSSSRGPVVHLLTDLNDNWHFSWWSKPKEIEYFTLKRPQAINLIYCILHKNFNLEFNNIKYSPVKNLFKFEKSPISPLSFSYPKKLDHPNDQENDIGDLDSVDLTPEDQRQTQLFLLARALYKKKISFHKEDEDDFFLNSELLNSMYS